MAAADAPVAPVNNARKFFIANIDYQTTASQVKQFFSAFGNVNHVKLIPHSSSSSSNYTDDSDAARQRHKGYGFLFMLDDPSTLAVERYVNAFPGNKIEMLGRKGVFVKRQMGMGREGGGISSNTNVGRVTSSNAYNSDGGANYQYLWGQYLDYDAHQTQYNTNTTASTTTMTSGYEHVGQYSQVNAANATNYPQQPQAVTVQSSQGLSDYYALQPTYSQPQVQQHSQQQQQSLLEYVPAPQHLQYSSTPSSAILPSASSTTQYNQHQYPNGSNYVASYQANYVVPQQSSTQFVVQQHTMYAIPAPAVYINQPQVPPPPRTTLEYSQNSQLPLSQMPQQSGPSLLPPPPPAPSQQKQLNRWEQWQQPQLPPQPINHNPRSTQQPNYPLRGTGEVGGGGGKWNGGGMMGSYNRGMGGGDGGGGRGGGSGGGGAPISGGGNGREGRRNRPY